MPNPICNTNAIISRDKRTVVLLAPEQTTLADSSTAIKVCTRGGVFEQALIYDSFDPVTAEFDTIQLNRARNSLGSEGFAVGIGTLRFRGSTYIAGSGYANVPPVWSKFLRSSGWIEKRYSSSASSPPTGTFSVDPVTTGTPTSAPALAMEYTSKWYYKISATVATTGESILSAASTTMASATAGSGTVGTEVDFSGITLPGSTLYVNIYRTFATNAGTAPANPSDYFLIDRLTAAQFAALTSGIYRDGLPDSQLVDPAADEAGTVVKTVWEPANEQLEVNSGEGYNTLTIYVYLDGRLHLLYNFLSTVTFSADAGQPVKCDIDGQAKYTTALFDANPNALATPAFPDRLINIGCKLTPKDTLAGFTAGTDYQPVVKSFSWTSGTQITPRLDANAEEGILEYMIAQEYQPRLNLVVEVEKSKQRDYIEAFKQGLKFWTSVTVGQTAGKKITFQSDTSYDVVAASGTKDYVMQLASAPTYVDNNGARCYNLEFVPTPGESVTEVAHAGFFKVTQH